MAPGVFPGELASSALELILVETSDRHFASASNLLALTVALARILALKR